MKSNLIMNYVCKGCGKVHNMYIEERLLDKQPVPFMAMCYCGGFSYHHNAANGGDVLLDKSVDIKETDSYFETDRSGKADACGIPHIYNPTTGQHTNKGYSDKRASRKIGRNAPCPCGSGKKYKRCCIE